MLSKDFDDARRPGTNIDDSTIHSQESAAHARLGEAEQKGDTEQINRWNHHLDRLAAERRKLVDELKQTEQLVAEAEAAGCGD